jgi:HEAT repeat protein
VLPRYVVLFSILTLVGLSARAAGADAESAADEELLRAAHIPTDGPGLLEFFRKRTPDAQTRSRIEELIGQLGSSAFIQRERAGRELTSFGPRATALLRKAMLNGDLEVRWRAEQALHHIEGEGDPAARVAAARLLGRRKPAETAEALLAYLPGAEDEAVAEEACFALVAVAVRDGEAEPVLVRGLTDKSAVKRGAAAAALCRAGCREQLPAVRRLLRDPEPFVRRQVALALVEAREKDAVPVMIALLTELAPPDAGRVEEVLLQLAADKAPRGGLDGDLASRRKYREAWEDWWKQHGRGVDLAEVEWLGRSLGYTLLAQLGSGGEGRVQEIDHHGNTRWQIEGLQYPIDVQAVDSERVLIAEYSARKVTERNHKGEILWQTQVAGMPVCARRLANGNTFIATPGRAYEVDRTGTEVWAVESGQTLVAACPLRDGGFAAVCSTGEYQRLDRKGEVVKSFRVGAFRRSTLGMHIQVLPNGHVLVPLYTANCVVEYDGDGKQVWSAQAFRPTCAQRLPNGYTLISSRMSNLVVEVDRKGREVWNYRCEGRAMRAQQR